MTMVRRPVVGSAQTQAPWRPLRVVAFFVLAYCFSWAWAIPCAATGHTVTAGQGWPTHLPTLVGPLLAAVVVTLWSQGAVGVRDLTGRMLQWRLGWRWWLICFSPLAALAAVLGVMALAGASIPARAEFARFSGLPSGWGVTAVTLTVIVINGFGEETGWRGFALPELQGRFGPVAATLILAGGWAVWHIPQFFLLDTYKNFSLSMVPVFFAGLTCGALVLTWLYNRTASVLAVALWHSLTTSPEAPRPQRPEAGRSRLLCGPSP